ncbi:Rossmann-like and DUF2520 domain-containing protein [Marinifilum caeruleilacunae]|uniref:DUF2520 domain-containing protein n=1 Tax=Marinifilum caeruleilacunae TaxID=2499076 RepID=A0ABX1WUJ0_9BACT|nr:DUF2520 domain-containing protein [Marinifilum caeruleilacunae]NOU59588.1 DUF2520 domain-containing protein [Marinifilum caeruleilacunae]
MNRINQVIILGAGNLATQLAIALNDAGVDILQIYSRTKESASALAQRVNANPVTELNKIQKNADLYIFALSDKALQPVLDQLAIPIGNVVHTAGSIPMDVFENYSENYGVFYPLQTFSKNRKVDFSKIPICIEANSEYFQEDLFQLGERISDNLHEINSEQRKQLHLSAVFTCNFANHMYSIGQKLLAQKEVDFDLLKPLIEETAAKVQEMDPVSAQTGPAVRFDEEIMTKHENELKDIPDFQKLYRFVSESIFKMHSNKK